jgi:hypothetical protein
MWRIRFALPILVSVTGLGAGCSKGPTTKPGPLGEMDLTAKLPVGVTVPADVKSFEATHQICATGKGTNPSRSAFAGRRSRKTVLRM